MSMWNVDQHPGGRELLNTLCDATQRTRVCDDLRQTARANQKDPKYVQAGATLLHALSELDEGAYEERYAWLGQGFHGAPRNVAHTYVYREQKKDSCPKHWVQVYSKGGPNFMPDPSQPSPDVVMTGTEGIFVTSYADKEHGANGSLFRGKEWRRVIVTKQASIPGEAFELRSIRACDTEPLDDYVLVHVAVSEDALAAAQPPVPLAIAGVPQPGAMGGGYSGDGNDAHGGGEQADGGDGLATLSDMDNLFENERQQNAIDDLDHSVHDNHEPRISALEKEVSTLKSGGVAPAASPSSEGGAPTLQTRICRILGANRTERLDKNEVRRRVIHGQGGPEYGTVEYQTAEPRTAEVNQVLYELQREGKVGSEAAASGAKQPLWRIL